MMITIIGCHPRVKSDQTTSYSNYKMFSNTKEGIGAEHNQISSLEPGNHD